MNTAINHFPRTPDAGVVAVLPNKLSALEVKKLSQYERVIERGLQTFLEVGTTFARVRDEQLWREGYSSFKDYLLQRWQITDRHGRHMIEAAKVVENLKASDPAMPLPTTESQARPLTSLPPSQVPEVWKTALASAPSGKVTAKHVQAAVEQKREAETPKPIIKPLKFPGPIKVDHARLDYGGDINNAESGMQLGEKDPCKIKRPFSHEGRLFCVGGMAYSGATRKIEANAFELIPAAQYSGPARKQFSYEGSLVVWQAATYRLGPKVQFFGVAEDPMARRIKEILLLVDEAVVGIRRVQDKLDGTDTPCVKACNAAVREMESVEAKFQKKAAKKTK